MLIFADLLGLEPDLQRALRPRTRSSRERNGLPRCRRRCILHATSAGQPEVEGQGHRRIWSPSVGRARTGRVFSVLDVCPLYSVRPAHKIELHALDDVRPPLVLSPVSEVKRVTIFGFSRRST
jgi:hypothetical protein